MGDRTTTIGGFETAFGDALEAVPDDRFDREQFVPGIGPLDVAVALVGEGPGELEVAEAKPFVGQAGGQLDRALEAIEVDLTAAFERA